MENFGSKTAFISNKVFNISGTISENNDQKVLITNINGSKDGESKTLFVVKYNNMVITLFSAHTDHYIVINRYSDKLDLNVYNRYTTIVNNVLFKDTYDKLFTMDDIDAMSFDDGLNCPFDSATLDWEFFKEYIMCELY